MKEKVVRDQRGRSGYFVATGVDFMHAYKCLHGAEKQQGVIIEFPCLRTALCTSINKIVYTTAFRDIPRVHDSKTLPFPFFFSSFFFSLTCSVQGKNERKSDRVKQIERKIERERERKKDRKQGNQCEWEREKERYIHNGKRSLAGDTFDVSCNIS